MKEHLQAIVTVLSLVNPVVCGAMFARNRAHAEQWTDATKVALAIAVILIAAAPANCVGSFRKGDRICISYLLQLRGSAHPSD
jgi:hypothetical protein